MARSTDDYARAHVCMCICVDIDVSYDESIAFLDVITTSVPLLNAIRSINGTFYEETTMLELELNEKRKEK